MIISAIGVLFLLINRLISAYFLRNDKFWNDNSLKRNYSNFILLSDLLLIFIVVIHHLDTNTFNTYVKITLLNLHALLQILDFYLNYPYMPSINKMQFKITFVQQIMGLIIAFNVLSDNTIINYKELLIVLLLALSGGIVLAETLYDLNFLSFLKTDANLNAVKGLYFC